MDQNEKTGLRLRAGTEAPLKAAKNRSWTGLAAVLLLYGAAWGAALSMLQMGVYWPAPLAGAAVIALFGLFVRTKKIGLALLAALLLTVAAYSFLRRSEVTDGLRLIANRMFERSEASQAYEYDWFAVSAADSLYPARIRAAFLLLSVLTGVLFGAASSKYVGVLSVCIFALSTFAAAYFGVAPAFGWSLVLVASVGLSLIVSGKGGERFRALLGYGGAVLLLLSVIAGFVLLLAPGRSDRVTALEERMRDAMAFQTVSYTDTAAQETEDQAEPDAEQSERRKTAAKERPEITWPELPPVVLLIALTLLVLFVPAVISDRHRKRVARSRAGLDDKDRASAIRAMFLYSMRWLRAAGVTPLNAPCPAYLPQLRRLMPEGYADVFAEAALIWREAAFSDHEMTKEQCDIVRLYVERTKKDIWAVAGWKKRLLIKYRHAL